MKTLLFLTHVLLLMMINEPTPLFDFVKTSDLSNWYVVDDGVMGGRSDGHFGLSEEGHGVFSGDVSLENNGGFSSVRYRFDPLQTHDFTKCKLRLKGDGKRYQFRLKTDKKDRHAYIYYFETSGEWETISIPLADMYPTFRGRRLDMPNYPAVQLEEIAFLIANKKAEPFQLQLDRITIE